MSNPAILERWAAHLTDDLRRSAHTVRAYTKAAQRLLLAQDGATYESIGTLDASTLRRHLAMRRAEGLSNASAARELSALKSFIRFAQSEAGMEQTGAPRLRGPRIKKGLPRPVTPDEAVGMAERVDSDASEGWIGLRDRAVLLLLYGAGMRVAEALSLTAEVLPLGETLTVTGKGSKQRVVPILPQLREAVEAYVEACPYPLPKGEPLFRGAKGGPLSQGMVQKATARARRSLGLPDTATPHALRHSFATHLLGEGADLRSLQELLGHASLGSTQIYTKVDAATMLDTYRSAHPRERDD
ncbi:tyrosine recombinase XerC [Qipengyuania sp. DSG2-2]|uniref:tyrosine recombinase XerC n=1 Tax=Qipengyuania sp. DGS2-2 TaxID=3349631 RepID=UPI0036D328C0